MRMQQFQCVGNAGCARVAESRGFHRWRPPRPVVRRFFARLDGNPQRSSLFIERLFPCCSTFGLVMMAATKSSFRDALFARTRNPEVVRLLLDSNVARRARPGMTN